MWVHDDGYRLCAGMAFAFAAPHNGNDWGDRFPAIVEAAARLRVAIVPDRRRGHDCPRRQDAGGSTLAQRAIAF